MWQHVEKKSAVLSVFFQNALTFLFSFSSNISSIRNGVTVYPELTQIEIREEEKSIGGSRSAGPRLLLSAAEL